MFRKSLPGQEMPSQVTSSDVVEQSAPPAPVSYTHLISSSDRQDLKNFSKQDGASQSTGKSLSAASAAATVDSILILDSVLCTFQMSQFMTPSASATSAPERSNNGGWDLAVFRHP